MESSGINSTFIPLDGSDTTHSEDKYFGLVIGILVFLLGTVGNGLTVWAYIRNKNLQSSFNVLIANLCLIDLLFTVVVIPFILPGYVVGENIFSQSLCSFISYFYYIALASSLYNLVAIAINRYIGIVWASSYQRLFSGKRLAICLTSIWLVPAILYLPVVIGGGYAWNEDVLRCAIANEMPRVISWYNAALNAIFQAIPLLILIFAYTAIFRKVKQVKSKMKGHQKTRKSLRSTSSASGTIKQRSGNTSDDTGDELKPSSLVEGITFKPVKNVSDQRETASASHEMSHKGAEVSGDETNSIDKHPSVSASEDTNEAATERSVSIKKRNSIWNILIQNKTNKFVSTNGHKTLQKTSSSPSYDGDVVVNMDLLNEQNSEPPLQEFVGLTKFHRKKSLSTPTLPTLDLENFNLSRADSRSNFPTHRRQYEDEKTSDSKISNNNEKTTRSRTMSDTTQIITTSKTTNSLKIQKTRKEKLSTSCASDNESINNKSWTRKSTLRKSKKSNEKDRQRNRTLRKRKERERQLAYSSFMICIAFAVCILPTSLLYLIRVFTQLDVSSSTILIVSCFSWLHAIVNPWIYGYLNTQYRKEYLRILRSIKSKICQKKQTSKISSG